MRAQKSKGGDPWHWRVRNSAHVSDRYNFRDILDFVEEGLMAKLPEKVGMMRWIRHRCQKVFNWLPEGLNRYVRDGNLAWSVR
jgi:hypothetical protein